MLAAWTEIMHHSDELLPLLVPIRFEAFLIAPPLLRFCRLQRQAVVDKQHRGSAQRMNGFSLSSALEIREAIVRVEISNKFK